LQNVQDFIAKTLDVASLSVDDNGPITAPSNFSTFCINHTRRSKLGLKRCNECDIKWGKIAAETGGPIIYQCHAGLTDFAVPVMVKGKHIATILGGQVLTSAPDENHFRALARELGLDEDEYINEVKKIKIVPPEKVQAVADLFFVLGNSIATLAYLNLQLSELGFGYKMPRDFLPEEWFFSNCKDMKAPLTSREFEILKLIVLGKNNNEIAAELFISVHTAKKNVSSLLEKLFVTDRVQMAVKAVREGLI